MTEQSKVQWSVIRPYLIKAFCPDCKGTALLEGKDAHLKVFVHCKRRDSLPATQWQQLSELAKGQRADADKFRVRTL